MCDGSEDEDEDEVERRGLRDFCNEVWILLDTPASVSWRKDEVVRPQPCWMMRKDTRRPEIREDRGQYAVND